MSLPIFAVGVVAYLLGKNRNVVIGRGEELTFPYTLYNCNIGRERIVVNQADYDNHIAAGFVTDLSLCPIDSAFGRDFGEWDYANSVDDMEAVVWTNEWETTDRSNSVVVIWSKQKLTYDPLQERRGYYNPKSYCIGNLERNDYNYDGDSIRTFGTLQAAISYYESISDTSGGGSGGGIPDGYDPEVFPDDDDDAIDPIDPIAPVNPPSGFGDNVGTFVSSEDDSTTEDLIVINNRYDKDYSDYFGVI